MVKSLKQESFTIERLVGQETLVLLVSLLMRRLAAAITGMDGKDIHGRLFHVNYATERTRGFRSGGGGYSQNDGYRTGGGYSQNDGNASGGSYSQSPSDGYGSQSQSSGAGYDGTSEGRSTGGTKDDFGYDDDESKWAITVAGGIPPLVQILEIGSSKAKEDSAIVIGNLCNHSEDIRACVESADVVPALIWLW
jgi:hypothetical protein